MDLSLTSEQHLLRDSAETFVLRGAGFSQYQRSLSSPNACDPALWHQLADLGWLALAVPEDVGGIGGSAVDLALVAEALGRGMVIEPFVSGVVAPVKAIVAGGTRGAHAELLERVAAGTAQLALAYTEKAARYVTRPQETRAVSVANGFIISGAKHCVLNAPAASHLVVSAQVEGGRDVGASVGLFLVPRKSVGVEVSRYQLLGGGVAGDVVLDRVQVPTSSRIDPGGMEALDAAINLAVTVSCAQALGAMQALFERTRDYLQTRKQFGVPIGSFQVLQHRLVDMSIEIEQSRSLVMFAASLADADDPIAGSRAASAAKAYLHKAAKYVAQQAVQLHGAIGVTEELDVGHYFRQLTAFCAQWGDRDFHLSRFREASTTTPRKQKNSTKETRLAGLVD